MRKSQIPWLTRYINYIMRYSPSPEHFHFWAGATIIGSALKRSTWVDRGGGYNIYPNLFTIFVGLPGTGKGAAITPAVKLAKDSGIHNVLSDRMTIEFLLERLSKGFSTSVLKNGQLIVNTDTSALVSAPELSVFLRSNSSDSLGDLCQLWDNESFSYSTRHKGVYPITDPCISLLGGSSPRWLTKSIPQDAVGGGFTRRVNFVYTKDNPNLPDWDVKTTIHTNEYNDLIDDLRHIVSRINGPFTSDSTVAPLFNDYNKNVVFDNFDDEATTAFKSSKWVNITKLAMILCASRSDDMVLTKWDFLEAFSAIDKVEEELKMVFRFVGESDDARAGALIMDFVNDRGITSRSDITKHLWRHVSNDDISRLLTTFVEVGSILEVVNGGKRMFKSTVVKIIP